MKLLFGGDIMPGGVLPYQNEYCSPELKQYLSGFDFRIGTLEAAIGTNIPFDPIKMKNRANIIFARNEDLNRVKEIGMDVVSLANNHVFDLGEEGLLNTIEMLSQNKIQYCGAGKNIEEASRPAVVEKDGVKVAIFAYCYHNTGHWQSIPVANENQAGINPLVPEKVLNDIKRAKGHYDHVIVLPHWGNEYTSRPTAECVSWAKRMIEAGAIAVLGSHPHQIQPSMNYKQGYICFSMGNFLFPDFYMQPPRPIWYPDANEDLTSIEPLEDYPFPVEKPIKRVWSSYSRYGCVADFDIYAKSVGVSRKYVHLSLDNVLSLSELDTDLDRLLCRESFYIRHEFVGRVVKSFRRMMNSKR